MRCLDTILSPTLCTATRGLGFALLVLLLASLTASANGQTPVCIVEPDSLNFCSAQIGQTKEASFVITNSGGGVLNGQLFANYYFLEFLDLPNGHLFALGAGESLEVRVGFAPNYQGAYQGQIQISGTGCGPVPCHGWGQYPPEPGPPNCSLVPYNLNFGPVVIGEAVADDIWIINSGGGYLAGSVPSDLGDLSIPWACDFEITGHQIWDVIFSPTVAGLQQWPLDFLNECFGIGIEGIGLYPHPYCELETSTLAFGPTQVGDASYRTVTVTNLGNELWAGYIQEGCGDFRVINGWGPWGLSPGDSRPIMVEFTPSSPGEQTCELDLGQELCGPIQLTGTGVELAPEPDIIGIWFQQTGLQNTYVTAEPDELVTAYLMILNPSTPYGTWGWECCVEVDGSAEYIWFDLEGEAVNVETPPCFAVGFTGSPLLGADSLLLATVQFIQPDPDQTSYLYIHPIANPSLPGVPAYADGADAGNLIPLGWASGAEEVPVAVVNPGSPTPVTDAPRPVVTALHANYPNPFNPQTTLRFDIARAGQVSLEIYDLAGRRVITLVNEHLPAGAHQRQWEGRDELGRTLSSGVYYGRLATVEGAQMIKMILLK